MTSSLITFLSFLLHSTLSATWTFKFVINYLLQKTELEYKTYCNMFLNQRSTLIISAETKSESNSILKYMHSNILKCVSSVYFLTYLSSSSQLGHKAAIIRPLWTLPRALACDSSHERPISSSSVITVLLLVVFGLLLFLLPVGVHLEVSILSLGILRTRPSLRNQLPVFLHSSSFEM